jgi:hypothetical protein
MLFVAFSSVYVLPFSGGIFMSGKPSKEARERYNEKRREERAKKKLEAHKLAVGEPKKSRGAGRTRNFATVVYPESALENWVEILREQHIPAFISPLHEDKNPDGTEKKPHYHVMIMFEGVKTDEQAKAVFSAINGVGLERINTLRGYARYLCHLDDPDTNKQRYNPEDVQCLCGADYFTTIGLPTDKFKAIREMRDFCRDNGVVSYMELFDYACDERQDWYRVLCENGTYVIKEYLKSKYWTELNKTSPRP